MPKALGDSELDSNLAYLMPEPKACPVSHLLRGALGCPMEGGLLPEGLPSYTCGVLKVQP